GLGGARHPPHIAVRQLLAADFGIVLGLKAVFEHLKLKHADHADDDLLKPDAGALERLNGAFLAQLHDALDELLALEAVYARHAGEKLRRKDRDAREPALFACAQRIAQREDAGIKQTDDVARVGILNGLALIGHELLGLLELHH